MVEVHADRRERASAIGARSGFLDRRDSVPQLSPAPLHVRGG